MAYKVIASFHDLEDNKRLYEKGQTYPREGFEANEERIQALSTHDKGPFIEVDEIPDVEFPKHTGGGYYELSNGEKVQGKEKAIDAENALKSGE